MFCQQKSPMPSKTTKLVMQIPQMRIEKASPKKRETKIYGWELSDRGEGDCEAFQRINDKGYENLHSASTNA